MHAGSLSSETLEGLHSHYKCLKRLLKQSYLLTVQGVLKVLCSFPKRETFFFFFFIFLLFVNFHICQQLTTGSIEQSFILFDNKTSYKIGMEFYDQVQDNLEQLHRR